MAAAVVDVVVAFFFFVVKMIVVSVIFIVSRRRYSQRSVVVVVLLLILFLLRSNSRRLSNEWMTEWRRRDYTQQCIAKKRPEATITHFSIDAIDEEVATSKKLELAMLRKKSIRRNKFDTNSYNIHDWFQSHDFRVTHSYSYICSYNYTVWSYVGSAKWNSPLGTLYYLLFLTMETQDSFRLILS